MKNSPANAGLFFFIPTPVFGDSGKSVDLKLK
jgi:hypothetical protein